MSVQRVLQRVTIAILLLAAIAVAFVNRESIHYAEIEQGIARLGGLAPLAYIALYVIATVLLLPGSILALAAGVLFGPVLGSIYALAGATAGATLAFLVARYLAADWVAEKAGGRLEQLIAGVEAEGWRFVAFVRLVPLFPFNLVNYGFGLTRIGLTEYVLASFVCMAPGAVAYTYLGYAGMEAASGRAGAIHKALLALALLAAVAFLPRLVRRLKGQRYTDAASLKRRLESGEKLALLDVRTAEEFRGPLGHIAGATNIPIGEMSGTLSELNGIKGPIVTI